MKLSSISAAVSIGLIGLASAFQSSTKNSPLSSFSYSPSSSSSSNKKHSHVIPTTNNNNKRLSSSSSSTTQLDALPSPITALASSPIGAISVLAGIVTVHEFGHYLAARSYNISVEEFAVGFGPKLTGFTAFGNEFNLRALPLGGYVRFPINYDVNATQELENKARDAFMERRKEEEWGPIQDIINIATFGIWDENRRKANKAKQALEASEQASKRNWFQNAIKPKIQKDNEDPEDFEIDYYDDPDLLQNRPWFQRAVVLSMGVIFNMLLSYSLYFGEIRFGSGIPQPIFDNGVVVSQQPLKGGSSVGLLQQGDIIVGVNGNPLVLSKKGGSMAAQKQVGDVISAIRATPDGESVDLQIKRGNSNNKNNNSPTTPTTTTQNIAVQPKKTDGSTQSIGIMLSPSFLEMKKIQSDETFEAVGLAYRYFSDIFKQTLDGFLTLLGTLLMGKGPPPGAQVSGPVGLIKTGTDVVSTKDLAAVLAFAGALSINLGVINALPLPALDGGQLIFVLAEAVTGRKVDQRLQEGITSAAVLLLLFVTLSTTFSDVGSIFFAGK